MGSFLTKPTVSESRTDSPPGRSSRRVRVEGGEEPDLSKREEVRGNGVRLFRHAHPPHRR